MQNYSDEENDRASKYRSSSLTISDNKNPQLGRAFCTDILLMHLNHRRGTIIFYTVEKIRPTAIKLGSTVTRVRVWYILSTTLPLSLPAYSRKKEGYVMKKEYKGRTCTSENSVVIKCLWPEQRNNSPLLRKHAPEICFPPKNKILLMKSIANFKN